MRKTRGSVLVQVLMTAVLVSIIAAGMLHLLLLRSQAIKRSHESAAGAARSNLGFDAILASWAAAGGKSCSATPEGFSTVAAGTPGACNCIYQRGDIYITAASSGGKCGLSIKSTPPL